jgi:methenyltetrahydrofolate cyclohydrolase
MSVVMEHGAAGGDAAGVRCSPAMGEESLVDRPTRDLLDAVASDRLGPGAGSVAALTAALAAAVATSVARLSGEQAGDADQAVAQAEALRERLVLLADANANAYEEAARSLGREGPADPVRDAQLGSDLARAAYTPLSIAEVAADVAELAAILAERGNPDVRADAAVAACLAEAAAFGAAHLVRINLGMAPDDEHIGNARGHAHAAAAARARVVAA